MNKRFGLGRVPPDLFARPVREGMPTGQGEVRRDVPGQVFPGTALYLGRGFQGRSVQISTASILVIPASYSIVYLILNPSRSVGLTNFGDVQNTLTTAVAGNTQATPIGVANFLTLRLMLEVTANVGTWDFIAQTRNPMSGIWIDSQTVFAGVFAAATTLYANVGGFGNDVDFAMRWNPVAPGAITFRLSYVLKEGTIGSGAGASQTLFIGPNDGVSSVSGYPILEGQEKQFIVGEGVEVWGIGLSSFIINTFELQ